MFQTLMAHVSEDILLSRIDQSGLRPKCAQKPGTPLLPIEVSSWSSISIYVSSRVLMQL